MQPQDPTQKSNSTPPSSPPDGAYAPSNVPGYDSHGHPIDTPDPIPHQMYYSRPLAPARPVIPPHIQEKHEQSKLRYPHLNLSEGEYIITDVSRHPIGLIRIWALVSIGVAAVIGSLFLFTLGNGESGDFISIGLPPAMLALISITAILLALVVGYLATYVYKENHMYLTNESIIQNIQITPFAKRQQTVSLSNVEDASYAKPGILSTLFDYGEVRLSTEGEETTYRFNWAIHPEKQVTLLNNAVEAFKHGRPVD